MRGHILLRLILLSAVVLFHALDIPAQNMQEYHRLSLVTLKNKANGGDVVAQCELGGRYRYGAGGAAEDAEKAEFWMKKAADNGYGRACNLLGLYYIVDSRDEDALFYFRKGASLGDGGCYYRLFEAYEPDHDHRNIRGVEKNETLAGQMLLKAANARCPDSFHDMFLAYNYGAYGIRENKNNAIFWLKKYCDSIYADYLGSQSDVLNRYWQELAEKLKELGCDYDPALHVDEYKAWLENKPTPGTSSGDAGVSTSSLTRRSTSEGGSYVPQTTPVYGPGPGPVYNPQPQLPFGSGVSSSTPSAPAEPRKYRCPHCQNGSITVTDNSVPNFGLQSTQKRCPECGFIYSTPTVHYHRQCSHCNGTGWVTYN